MTYWIAVNSSKKETYHEDKDCHQLHQTENIREATEFHLEHMTPCKVCIKEEREKVDKTEWMSFTKRLRANPEQFK